MGPAAEGTHLSARGSTADPARQPLHHRGYRLAVCATPLAFARVRGGRSKVCSVVQITSGARSYCGRSGTATPLTRQPAGMTGELDQLKKILGGSKSGTPQRKAGGFARPFTRTQDGAPRTSDAHTRIGLSWPRIARELARRAAGARSESPDRGTDAVYGASPPGPRWVVRECRRRWRRRTRYGAAAIDALYSRPYEYECVQSAGERGAGTTPRLWCCSGGGEHHVECPSSRCSR